MIPEKTNKIIEEIEKTMKLTPKQKEGVSIALRWVNDNYDCLPVIENKESIYRTVMKAIHETIRIDFNYEPSAILGKKTTREHEKVFLRSCAWCVYNELTHSSQQETACAFGNVRQRVTFMNMKRVVSDLTETSRKHKEIYQKFRDGTIRRTHQMVTI